MKPRYRLFLRRGSVYYAFDNDTKRFESLHTKSKSQAVRLLQAKNEAQQQPSINLQIARAYLMASDPGITKRTWQYVMEEIARTKQGSTQVRWERAIKDKAFNSFRHVALLETKSELLLHALHEGTVATNVFLRRIHNFALDMNWLPWPIIPKRQWPAVRFKEKRAITHDEYERIIDREKNPERRGFYQLCWHLGGSQGDIACLHAENIDWQHRTIAYKRQKTGTSVVFHFGAETEEILRSLPNSGPLFPYLISVRASDRATEFKQRCNGLRIEGITLHSFRYAWCERARVSGYPETFAQQAVGHNSKAVHRAYARRAQVKLPSLEDYEKAHERKIIALKIAS